MNERSLIGSWIRRFLLEHLVSERNLARNTRLSYRDALSLLLPFVSRKQHKSVDQLAVTDLTADLVRSFLSNLETSRHSSIATRNQRLAAVHSLAAFIGAHSPEHVQWCAQVRAVPFKKTTRAVIGYLDKPEMDAFLSSPDQRTELGRRDYALLLFLYNSGARADELARLTIGDVDLASASVRIVGKGGKQRHCPLWRLTVKELAVLVGRRDDNERVFLNRYGQPMTRFGIHTLVEKYAERVKRVVPSMAKKRVSPHTIRHSTACHLLRAGVDINTIRGWLGHVSLETTNIYAEIDLEMKANALAKCEVHPSGKARGRWHQPALMDFLRTL
ncbi:MAG: integrase/recombinase XerD [Gammaproteobacteria bacterium]|nr:integrase/recombinase XerD [Gammaproteobacteria bacterium]